MKVWLAAATSFCSLLHLVTTDDFVPIAELTSELKRLGSFTRVQ